MMFATAAIGLQPFVSSSGSGCSCDTTSSVTAATLGNDSSCCNSLKKEQAQTDCCASKPASAKECCCNRIASVCECDDCGCSVDNDKNSPLPAIPTNETTEVVTPVLICAAPIVGYPRDREVSRVDYQDTAAEFAALSSQETCILLSRFTC
jgi:hypothetical protein